MIKIGDSVVLKGQLTRMTVKSLSTRPGSNQVSCVWHKADGNVAEGTFSEEMLYNLTAERDEVVKEMESLKSSLAKDIASKFDTDTVVVGKVSGRKKQDQPAAPQDPAE